MYVQTLRFEELGLSQEARRSAEDYFAASRRRTRDRRLTPAPEILEHRRALFAGCIVSGLHASNGVDMVRAAGLFPQLVRDDALASATSVAKLQGRAVLVSDLHSYRIRGPRGRPPSTACQFLPLDSILGLFLEDTAGSDAVAGDEGFPLGRILAAVPELGEDDARLLRVSLESLARSVAAIHDERRSERRQEMLALPSDDRDALYERAAIQELEGGVPRHVAEGAALAARIRGIH